MKTFDELQLRALLIRGLDGDGAAYSAFLLQLSELLRRYLRRSYASRSRATHEDIEDIVQEALIAIHSRRHTYERTCQ